MGLIGLMPELRDAPHVMGAQRPLGQGGQEHVERHAKRAPAVASAEHTITIEPRRLTSRAGQLMPISEAARLDG